MQESSPPKSIFEKQSQSYPGKESEMRPNPVFDDDTAGSNKLLDKKCIITGGDSGIGRAVAIAFAKEGADVAIVHLDSERDDANATSCYIQEKYMRDCITIPGDISVEKNCTGIVQKVLDKFGNIDVLINNAAVQFVDSEITDIDSEQLLKTFSTNIFSMFWMTQAVVPHLKEGSCIINTTSVTAYRGSKALLDYSSTKGAIVSFTRSLSQNLVDKGIRVNGVAPGPVWTPLLLQVFLRKKWKNLGRIRQ
jgi:NAD(P)-dependent dehydrogenase (short-subunit alcohol dehydrogenase family)